MALSFTANRRFIESVRDEPKKMLLPISGYEKVDVKSLEEACEPIKHLFDQRLKNYITVAKMNSTEPEDGLSLDESASIHLYTIEWDVHEDSLWMVLNQTLRLADPFFKLPPSEHTLLWRGVREDLSALYPTNKEFAWWAVSSCTALIKVLECSNYLGESGARTIFSIQTNNGKLICAHSYFEKEDEIVLPPGVYFKVIGILNPAKGLHIIQIREIAPPYPMLAEPFDRKQLKQTLPPLLTPQVPEIQKSYSTSVAPKTLKEPTLTAPKKNSPDSDKELTCKGHACANCGNCCDWYWRHGEDKKVYKKRDDANCIFDRYFRDDNANDYYHYRRLPSLSTLSSRSDLYHLPYYPRLCECEDNRL